MILKRLDFHSIAFREWNAAVTLSRKAIQKVPRKTSFLIFAKWSGTWDSREWKAATLWQLQGLRGYYGVIRGLLLKVATCTP